MATISVILPIFNTAPCLCELYNRLQNTLTVVAEDYEIIMVDDGSPDEAWKTIQDLAAADPHIKAIQLSRNFGQHPAIAAGFAHAVGDIIVLMDADLEDRPEDIPLLLERLTDHVDVVYTLKMEHNESLLTQFTSRLYHYVFSHLTSTNVPPTIGTFRAFTRRFLNAILSYPERNILYGPLMFYVGFKSEYVPVRHDARKHGSSGYTLRKRLALALNSILIYTDLPHRILVALGLVILLGCGMYSIALVGRYLLFGRDLPQGLTLIALLLTVSLGVLTFSLGILGAYVFRVYQEVLNRPRYIISRTINVRS